MKRLSERDICSKFITPAIIKAGWDLQRQIREEVTLTNGKVIVQGKTILHFKSSGDYGKQKPGKEFKGK